MDTPKVSSSSFRTAFALFAASASIAAAGWLGVSTSKAAVPGKASADRVEVVRGFSLAEWHLLAK